jgi:fatty acid desaturase
MKFIETIAWFLVIMLAAFMGSVMHDFMHGVICK